ncbi:tetratricopeptide repeat protein [Solicola gregarius]|uniref:Tetratricopeptide repeat protein n=1 Tax=Solicola gregarius TaxID=2908642 RepID=A0AA46YK77_9ACTN|nr:tetratricopeptide repeat protein [Solicola gregarius]UYM05202.1 tetratricopeptide repeat protein [Solicola gregarius]
MDTPEIPDEVTARSVDRHVRRSLQSLPERTADLVARHLAMAGLLIEEDPALAYRHALAAREKASRIAVVREACGETAYAAGEYAEALRDLRAARRMNGHVDYLPMLADCERALGRPERALELDSPQAREKLDPAGVAELAIVVAGARRDLGQAEAAARALERESLHSSSRDPWVARLRYAYADVLLELGRTQEAIEWFHRTVAVDGNRATDAEERLETLHS